MRLRALYAAFREKPLPPAAAFGLIWCITFLVYLPTARAGFVTDFTGWLDQMVRYGFWDNINRTHYQGRSLYQFTQFNTWVFYQLFGANKWAWHLLFVSLHAANAALLYQFMNRLFQDVGLNCKNHILFGGLLLFCISPYLSETIVWEPSFHFLQGLLLMIAVLRMVQLYISKPNAGYVVAAITIYFLSTFSLEIFYITPWLVFTLLLFYRMAGVVEQRVFTKACWVILAPLVVLFSIHILAFHAVYGGWVAHIGNDPVVVGFAQGLGKPLKYLCHLLLLVRFFPLSFRQAAYAFCDSIPGLVLFYGFVVASKIFIALRFKRFSSSGKIISLLWLWVLLTLVLLVPLWFDTIQLVCYDRYIYFTMPFFYMILMLLVSTLPNRIFRYGLVSVFVLVNIRFTILVTRYWMKSAHVIESLMQTFPATSQKTIVLLNIPQNMHGIPMIGAEQQSEFKLMYRLLQPGKAVPQNIYDGLAYNMESPQDGAHVTVLNDSTVKVTLNQWGTWWWLATQGAHSYENGAYRLHLTDPGHEYLITLKQPASSYQLLYSVGGQWKTVDMARLGEQD